MNITMLNCFLHRNVALLTMFVSVAGGFGVPANAQDCAMPYQMITKLHHPDPASYTVWEAFFGPAGDDVKFISAVERPENGVLALGLRTTMQGLKQEEPALIFVAYDRRGREEWRRAHRIAGVRDLVKVVPKQDGGVLVLGQYQKNDNAKYAPWLGFFSADGRLQSQVHVTDKHINQVARDIVPTTDQKGWALAVTAEKSFDGANKGIVQKHAVVYLLDQNGKERSSRAYILGGNNEITSLSVAKFSSKKSGYIATGYFESSEDRNMGWALRLNEDSSIAWQQEFSRGKSAKLISGSGYRDRHVLAFGDVSAANDGAQGVWLMMLNGDSGRVIWERYYHGETGDHDYEVRNVFAQDDGLISLLMMGRYFGAPIAEEGNGALINGEKYIPLDKPYAHTLTLSPRGVTLGGNSYYAGHGVEVNTMVRAENGVRIMAGWANMPSHSKYKDEREKTSLSNPPLKEKDYVNLPEVALSDKANQGLEVLKNKLTGSEVEEHTPGAVAHKESAKSSGLENKTMHKGWVVLGDAPDTYTDPCKYE